MYARFAVAYPAFLRFRITPEEGRAELRKRLAQRSENFLRLVEKGVFGHRGSPYQRLFALAGCQMGDLREAVRSHGLERALLDLRQAGVYVSYEEFKGRAPIVRSGVEIPARPGDFDNPFLKAAYRQDERAAPTGAGTRVMTDLDNLRAKATLQARRGRSPRAAVHAAGPLAWRSARRRPRRLPLPHRLRPGPGQVVHAGDARPSCVRRSSTGSPPNTSCGWGGSAALRLPRPEPVPVERAGVVARWVADTVKTRGACHLRAYVSLLARVSLAAQEEGLDLTGAVFGGGGEPPTPAKVQQISRSGARYLPAYSVTEFGRVGVACLQPVEVNDLHFREDHLAVIQHPRRVPGSELDVDAFLFSTLLPSAPKLAVNVESDDYGVIEERDCGCPLHALGLTRHVRSIRSFRKLTAEGMTLVGTDMVRILEEVLPTRFGGSSDRLPAPRGGGRAGADAAESSS